MKLGALWATMAASASIYIGLSFFEAVNGWSSVLTLLGAMAALFALYAAGFWLVMSLRGKQRWIPLVSGAILFRLLLMPAGMVPAHTPQAFWRQVQDDWSGSAVVFERFQLFDDDVWRYLWDGHVAASGINPFRYAANATALDSLEAGAWGERRDNINYAEVPTIYPPLAQRLFRLSYAIAPGSILAIKALLVLVDLGSVALIGWTLRALGDDPARVILYAWNPLVVKVFAGSAHIDSLLVLLMAAIGLAVTLHRPKVAGIALGLAVLAKLSPVVLIPLLVKRFGWSVPAIAAAVVGIGYLPYLDEGTHVFAGLAAFARDWQFNSGVYRALAFALPLVSGDPAGLAKALCGLLFLVVATLIVARDEGGARAFHRSTASLAGALLLFSPVAMPWYLTWLLPSAIASRQTIWLVWTGLVCLAFFVMVNGRENHLIVFSEYGALALAAGALKWQQKQPTRSVI